MEHYPGTCFAYMHAMYLNCIYMRYRKWFSSLHMPRRGTQKTVQRARDLWGAGDLCEQEECQEQDRS